MCPNYKQNPLITVIKSVNYALKQLRRRKLADNPIAILIMRGRVALLYTEFTRHLTRLDALPKLGICGEPQSQVLTGSLSVMDPEEPHPHLQTPIPNFISGPLRVPGVLSSCARFSAAKGATPLLQNPKLIDTFRRYL